MAWPSPGVRSSGQTHIAGRAERPCLRRDQPVYGDDRRLVLWSTGKSHLVRESVRERERLLRERSHLVHPVQFLFLLNEEEHA